MRRRVPAGQLEMFRQRAKAREARESDFRAQVAGVDLLPLLQAPAVDVDELAAGYQRWLARQPADHPWK